MGDMCEVLPLDSELFDSERNVFSIEKNSEEPDGKQNDLLRTTTIYADIATYYYGGFQWKSTPTGGAATVG